MQSCCAAVSVQRQCSTACAQTQMFICAVCHLHILGRKLVLFRIMQEASVSEREAALHFAAVHFTSVSRADGCMRFHGPFARSPAVRICARAVAVSASAHAIARV